MGQVAAFPPPLLLRPRSALLGRIEGVLRHLGPRLDAVDPVALLEPEPEPGPRLTLRVLAPTLRLLRAD